MEKFDGKAFGQRLRIMASKPFWYKENSEVGRTLAEILDLVCKGVAKSTRALLESETARLNATDNLDLVVHSGEVAPIPECRSPSNFNPPGPGGGAIKAGKPKDAKTEDGPALKKTSWAPKYFKAMAAKDPEAVAAAMEPAMPKFTPAISLVQSVDLAALGGAEKCGGQAGDVAKLVDLAALRRRFQAEAAKKKAFFGEPAVPTTVGVLDSGLIGYGHGIFDGRFFTENLVEKNGNPGSDDDWPRNDHTDDVVGSNYQDQNGRIKPIIPDGPDKSHGTKMASLVLGGPAIAAAWTGAFNPPVVRLRIVDFTHSATAGGIIDPHYMGQAIEYLHANLKPHRANIVNISLKTSADMASLPPLIEKRRDMLFVVAAGNDKLDLGFAEVYPARYGGKTGNNTWNLVTVGAHDLAGKRAFFSNYSADHVDLLAPGCLVEAMDITGNVVLDNGTSPATAVTSFAAALVRSLGETTPSEIKNRLILGADFDPALTDDVWSSGRLNILKAISLYHDVVEVKTSGGGTELRHVVLKNPGSLLGFCDFGSPLQIDFRKIVPHLSSGKLQYWAARDGKLTFRNCKQQNTDKPIGKILVNGTEQDGPLLKDVKEVIVGSYVRRQ